MPSSASRPRRLWGLAVLIGAAAATVLTSCSTGGSDPAPAVTVTQHDTPSGTDSTSTTPTTPPPSTTKPTGQPVHIRTANADNAIYGVGMPIIAYFSKKITNASALSTGTKVTVNGAPLKGGWYFEYSAANKGYPIEGHWRPEHFWAPHSTVHVDIPMKGKSAGTGLVFDNSLTLDFAIGASHIVTVDASTHKLTVVADGKEWGTFPVSLGASKTRTLSGTKVIMEKGRDIPMRGPGYYDPHVKYTQRLTYGGEYLHAAPWNKYNIDHGIDSSNGCTNLHPDDAKKLYGFLDVGDVVTYPNANGGKMQLGEGYGDWNVPWGLWQTGGLVHSS
jgi:lipoprotein-anchoring transpeptidase ErfK/SrfK